MSVPASDSSADVIHAPYSTTGPDAPAAAAQSGGESLYPQTPADAVLASSAEAAHEVSLSHSNQSALSELETDDGEQQQPQTTEATPEAAKAAQASRNEADKHLADKGVNLAEYEAEFTANGSLSEASLSKLEQAGIPRQMVAAYIQGQQALVNSFVSDVKALAGGDEGYANVINWAQSGLSEEEKTAYDKVMFSGDKDLIKLAVAGLVAKYKASEGSDPQLVNGRASASGVSGRGMPGFANMSEMQAAMRDPRYGRDPDYTREVERRTMRSTFM